MSGPAPDYQYSEHSITVRWLALVCWAETVLIRCLPYCPLLLPRPLRAFAVKVGSPAIPSSAFEGATTCASDRLLALLAAGSDVDAQHADDLETLVSF